MIHHRRSTTVSKDKLVLRNQGAKGVAGIGIDARESRWGIDIPENAGSPAGDSAGHGKFKFRVVNSDATVLDDEIGFGSSGKQARKIGRTRIDQTLNVAVVTGIAPLLPTIRIRFRECDPVSEAGEVAVDSPVVGRSSIPVRRGNAGTKDEYLHRAHSS